jgi:hypothetical protein
MTLADDSAKAEETVTPSLWLVVGDKLGDNAQAEIIIEALGWPYVRKSLRFKDRYVLGKPSFRASLHHVDLACSAALEPPWPALILTVGRRPVMAALWVRKQSQGRTRIAIIGRPRRSLHHYDLVIAPPQFRVPARANVLQLDLPLMRIDETVIAEAREQWRESLQPLPRPLTAVLVGGPTQPFRFDAVVARDLVARTLRATGKAGTLYFTTSRRTPEAVATALATALPGNARLYRWSPDRTDNPYLGLLAHADHFIVTGDSISMMTEVVRLGLPLAIYELPVKLPLLGRIKATLAKRLLPLGSDGDRGIRPTLGAALFRLGVIGYARDLSAMHHVLFARGLAVRLGEPFPVPGGAPSDASKEVAGRLAALFEP